MSDDDNGIKESPIITGIRNYMMKHGGVGGSDQKEATVAGAVEQAPAQGDQTSSWHEGNKITHDDSSVIHETTGG